MTTHELARLLGSHANLPILGFTTIEASQNQVHDYVRHPCPDGVHVELFDDGLVLVASPLGFWED